METILKKLFAAVASLATLVFLFSCNKVPDPEVQSIAFQSESLEMAVGEIRQLSVFKTMVGDNTGGGHMQYNSDIYFESDAPSVVSVSETGEATALKEGKAVITARCGDKEAQCAVTVIIPVEKLAFPTSSVSMKVNEELKTYVTVTPSNATSRNVEFELDDPSIVYVVREGATSNITITALKSGQTTITARCGGKEAHLFVYVDDVKVTKLTVAPVSFSLKAGETLQLTATVEPSNASNRNVSWESGNPDVVTVKKGLVTAERPGKTKIWAYCGDKSAVCDVTVLVPDGAVDLGLSVCWASCNLGASYNYMPGGYYAWGELTPKSTYTWSNYLLRQSGDSYENVTFKRYNFLSACGPVDKKTDFSDYDYQDDAARQALGGKWRVPSPQDFEELVRNCTAEWVVLPSLGQGIKFTSKVNGYRDQSIFLPACGKMYENTLIFGEGFYKNGETGSYMSSSLHLSNPRFIRGMEIICPNRTAEGTLKIYADVFLSRNDGYTVRPVW